VSFYDPTTAPDVFDIVWCKWPKRENPLAPGPWVRCVLVLDVRLMIDADETEWAAITAAYGTDAAKVEKADLSNNLLITSAEYRALGLHKSTVFKLDLKNRFRLAWAEKYFVPQSYVRDRGIVAGSLNATQQATVLTE